MAMSVWWAKFVTTQVVFGVWNVLHSSQILGDFIQIANYTQVERSTSQICFYDSQDQGPERERPSEGEELQRRKIRARDQEGLLCTLPALYRNPNGTLGGNHAIIENPEESGGSINLGQGWEPEGQARRDGKCRRPGSPRTCQGYPREHPAARRPASSPSEIHIQGAQRGYTCRSQSLEKTQAGHPEGQGSDRVSREYLDGISKIVQDELVCPAEALPRATTGGTGDPARAAGKTGHPPAESCPQDCSGGDGRGSRYPRQRGFHGGPRASPVGDRNPRRREQYGRRRREAKRTTAIRPAAQKAQEGQVDSDHRLFEAPSVSRLQPQTGFAASLNSTTTSHGIYPVFVRQGSLELCRFACSWPLDPLWETYNASRTEALTWKAIIRGVDSHFGFNNFECDWSDFCELAKIFAFFGIFLLGFSACCLWLILNRHDLFGLCGCRSPAMKYINGARTQTRGRWMRQRSHSTTFVIFYLLHCHHLGIVQGDPRSMRMPIDTFDEPRFQQPTFSPSADEPDSLNDTLQSLSTTRIIRHRHDEEFREKTKWLQQQIALARPSERALTEATTTITSEDLLQNQLTTLIGQSEDGFVRIFTYGLKFAHVTTKEHTLNMNRFDSIVDLYSELRHLWREHLGDTDPLHIHYVLPQPHGGQDGLHLIMDLAPLLEGIPELFVATLFYRRSGAEEPLFETFRNHQLRRSCADILDDAGMTILCSKDEIICKCSLTRTTYFDENQLHRSYFGACIHLDAYLPPKSHARDQEGDEAVMMALPVGRGPGSSTGTPSDSRYAATHIAPDETPTWLYGYCKGRTQPLRLWRAGYGGEDLERYVASQAALEDPTAMERDYSVYRVFPQPADLQYRQAKPFVVARTRDLGGHLLPVLVDIS